MLAYRNHPNTYSGVRTRGPVPHGTLSHSTADSWPDTLLDAAARADLDWTPDYDLSRMVEVMITEIKKIIDTENEED